MSGLSHIGIWGRTRGGKTTKAKEKIAGVPRVLVVDPDDEFQGIVDERLEIAGTDRAAFLPMIQYMAARWGGVFRLAIYPADGVDGAEFIDTLGGVIKELQDPYNNNFEGFELCILVDEIADFFPNRQHVAPKFWTLIRRGLKRGVFIIGTSQRMAEVGISFRSNCATDYYYPLQTTTDIDEALKRLGREYQPTLRQLNNHQFLMRGLDGQVTPGENPPQ